MNAVATGARPAEGAETLWRAWHSRGRRRRATSSSCRTRRWCSTSPRGRRAIPAHCEVDDLVSCGLMGLSPRSTGSTRARAPRSSSSRGRASTARSSTSCAATTGRRARSAATSAQIEQRRARSRRRRPPAERGRAGRRAGRQRRRPARASRASSSAPPSCRSTPRRVSGNDVDGVEIGDTIEASELENNPEHALLARERAATLRQAIQSLPERELQVLASVHVHQIPGAEIGGCSASPSRASRRSSRPRASGSSSR